MSSKGELLDPNQLTFNEHLERIQKLRNSIRKSVLEMANAIKDALDQLEDETFTHLANELGMGRSTLYKWKDIADSNFLTNNQDALPESFTSLYKIALIEKKVVKVKKTDSLSYLRDYLDKGIINPQMTIEDVNVLKKLIAEDFLKSKAAKQRKTTGHSVPSRTAITSIKDLVSKKKVFKTFIIEPNQADLSKFSEVGYFDEDIRTEIPIDKLLDSPLDGSVLGVIIVPNRYLPTGLKMMSAWGFNYADLVPAEDKRQMLIGWRGRGKNLRWLETEHELFEEVERVGQRPFISIWYDTGSRTGWSVAE